MAKHGTRTAGYGVGQVDREVGLIDRVGHFTGCALDFRVLLDTIFFFFFFLARKRVISYGGIGETNGACMKYASPLLLCGELVAGTDGGNHGVMKSVHCQP